MPKPTPRDANELLTTPAAIGPLLNRAPWMRVALRHLGVSEAELHDVFTIANYLNTVRARLIDSKRSSADELAITHWCSAFVNFCLKEAGITGMNLPNARSWLKWGKETTTPTFGDVAVFWRVVDKDLTTFGHVGFFVKFAPPNHAVILGGNQHDSVCFGLYPINRDKKPSAEFPSGLLGYRECDRFPAVAGIRV
jgi:uncharacterized protein (TIGR02594 family)